MVLISISFSFALSQVESGEILPTKPNAKLAKVSSDKSFAHGPQSEKQQTSDDSQPIHPFRNAFMKKKWTTSSNLFSSSRGQMPHNSIAVDQLRANSVQERIVATDRDAADAAPTHHGPDDARPEEKIPSGQRERKPHPFKAGLAWKTESDLLAAAPPTKPQRGTLPAFRDDAADSPFLLRRGTGQVQ